MIYLQFQKFVLIFKFINVSYLPILFRMQITFCFRQSFCQIPWVCFVRNIQSRLWIKMPCYWLLSMSTYQNREGFCFLLSDWLTDLRANHKLFFFKTRLDVSYKAWCVLWSLNAKISLHFAPIVIRIHTPIKWF